MKRSDLLKNEQNYRILFGLSDRTNQKSNFGNVSSKPI